MAPDAQHDEPLSPTSVEPPRSASSTSSRVPMERSFSQDIQEGTRELKEAAEQTRNIILDLALDGKIRWVSPSWTDVVGTSLDSVRGRPISDFIADNPEVFAEAIKTLQNDDSKSQFVRFTVKIGPASGLEPMLRDDPIHEGTEGEEEATQQILHLEGQGIMVFDRASGGESHTMWMLQPPAERTHVTIPLPRLLVEALGVGAEVLANHLNMLADVGASDPAHHPPPMPILCRVCERQITPWWFEKHSDLCVQEHRAELDVQMTQESLTEHRHAIVKVLDSLEVRKSRNPPSEGSPIPAAPIEYKGLAIGPASTPSSSSGSGLTSQVATPTRSRSPSTASRGHARARSFAVRRPQVRIVELILDLCDTALEISTPSIKDTKSDEGDDFRTQSPQSESRISQVLQWQSPSSNTMEQEQGLALLSADTERLCRAKVEAVLRHRRIIEYSERIRQEFTIAVEDCIAHAMRKAERIVAGESLSSSEDDGSAEGDDAEGAEDNPQDETTPMRDPPSMSSSFALPSMVSSISAALRNAEGPYSGLSSDRRSSSAAISTRSSSPLECPTPRSHRSTLVTNHPPAKRTSMLIDPEANDSDASLQSSVAGIWRTDSPSSDQGLSRRPTSKDRSRKSLVLYGLGTNSPHRQQSPGHPSIPQPPPSPLRMSKARLPSGETAPSPVTSPLLTTGEFVSPALSSHHHVHHHRRQSSTHSSDVRGPPSPKLSASHPPRAQPPSIKDFEIIKPISKGAFGSVYLSKKKSTGDYYAIKVLKKADMISKNQVTNVKAERAIMMWQGESDFVAKLYWTFSSKDYLYLVMEYLNGGDCASLIKILGGLPEDWCKKYIAEVVLGIEHLHSRGIVHRDLKPDNLLIDQKGHLKLTDFGLSRMGLVGRQKRALKSTNEPVPDLLKSGPFHRSVSITSSRSASFDFPGHGSPGTTPMMTPAFTGGLDQPSYFSLSRETSTTRESTRQNSGHKSDSPNNPADSLSHAFRSFSLYDSSTDNIPLSGKPSLIEEETHSQGSDSPDLFPLQQTISNTSQMTQPSSLPSQTMLPPPMALFDPEDTNRKFVGTPDYLAPETINGVGQDEMSDWWSVGCIMFEFLYGFPPFNAETPDAVFENILARRVAWPEEPDFQVSEEAKDLIDKLIKLDPRDRIGANIEENFPSGAAEIKNHPWFSDLNWDTLLEDEPQFVPNPENPEDTEYFDARGATLQSFPEEIEEQLNSPPALTPGGSEYPERPHDALLRVRTQVNAVKRGLMPLHIPPHVVRDSRSRRLSEPAVGDDFGNFTFKNLPVLEKANKDIVNKMRAEAMQAQSKAASSVASSPAIASPPSLEGSPLMPMPLKRTMSSSKGHRPASPSGLSAANSSPSRPSAPSSPLLVQFSTAQNHERRKTSGSSQSSSSLQPGSFFELPKDSNPKAPSVASSPIKHMRIPAASPAKLPTQRHSSATRSRSQTVGSQEGESSREGFVPGHHKRRSQLLHDVSPSSSDNEATQNKALLNVQRRRQSSRRFSQISMLEGPMYRPLDVLICEDHPVSRMVMERLFEKLRCRTITATNGPEALRLAVSQINFDIIIMEFKLPKLNGADIARMIRDTRNANDKTPIVCLTGYLKELPDVHHFDALIQKPPTLTKLTEALCKYCAWKPPPKDFKLAQPLSIPTPSVRPDRQRTEDSPSSTSSSFPNVPESYRGSSREDSIGSGFFSDLDSTRNEDIPVVIARQPTDDWPGSSGLGISEEVVVDQKPYVQSGFPHLVHTESAPPTANLGTQTPRKQRSAEVIKAKRQSLDKKMREGGGAEEGDDEDEELGTVHSRSKSPQSRTSHIGSKLGYEMLRTNSRGSVISMNNEEKSDEMPMLETKLQSLAIPEEGQPMSTVALTQPRKTMRRTESQHSHPEPECKSDDEEAKGHITPPIIFPQKPGHGDTKEIIEEEQKPTTPVGQIMEADEEPTPRPPTRVEPRGL